ncbi:MAG: ABC transporter ATP-binding protein [Deltaproteobacteria bacterium]|nr:ABC transporter ATP-binding protein [Deltaproteobacteria bacterium]
MPSILEISNVSRSFGGLKALDDLNLTLEKGVIEGLIGPNGAGKTTLFNVITGVYPPDQGSIQFMDKEIAGKKPHEIVALGIARTFQNIRLFPNMTVVENVLVGCHSRMRAGVWGALSRNRHTVEEEERTLGNAQKLLGFVGLKARSDDLARNLPYGDQRRLEMARALGADPILLLLDEPTAGMNPQETNTLTDFIRRIRDELGLTVLLIEHDMRVVMGISDRVTVLDQGAWIGSGTPREVQKNTRVIEAYLGKGAIQLHKRRADLLSQGNRGHGSPRG